MTLARVGVGIDIEERHRFEGLFEGDHPFLRRFYTDEEIRIASSIGDRAAWLSGRYCAKEAISKAIMELGDKSPDFRDIEIRSREDGCPLACVIGSEREYMINISISHSDENVVAISMVRKID